MTHASQSASKLRTALKWSLISALVIAGTWISVIAWWQTSHRVVLPNDVFVYLVLLPLAMLAAILVPYLYIRRRRNPATKDANLSQTGSLSASDETFSPTRQAVLPVLSVWAITSIGNNPLEFVQALQARRHRPRPDDKLLDQYGFPLFTCRVAELDPSTVSENLAQAAEAAGFEQPRDALLRALKLLEQVFDQIHRDWPFPPDTTDHAAALRAQGMLRGAAPSLPSADNQLTLQIRVFLSADLEPFERQQALTYVLKLTTALPLAAERVHVQTIPIYDEATVFEVANQFGTQATDFQQAQALLLLACDSTLCPTVAEKWESESRMFNTHVPNGLMMGEAAFGVLIANDAALRTASLEPMCGLAASQKARRESSADAPGKPTSDVLTQIIRQILASTDTPAEKINSVACDADHRTNRTLECIGAMLDQLPGLDAIGDRLAVNESCGHLGAASVMGALVAAITQANLVEKPVLMFNVSHVFERAAAVLISPNDMPKAA